MATFPTIDKCKSNDRKRETVVVADMVGCLLRDDSSFPYFALIAFDVGGIVRLLLLLLVWPLSRLLYYFVSESAATRVLIFATFAGVNVSKIESAATAVLPKFYSSDLHPDTWRVISACERRCIVTSSIPRIMVEPFLKSYLGFDMVLGTEIATYNGIATGFVCPPGVLIGQHKADALHKALRAKARPDIGIGNKHTDIALIGMCKEGYTVSAKPTLEAVRREELPKPIIFHDGRLVQKPTPLLAFFIILWFSIGFFIACLRIAIMSLLPQSLAYYALWALGIRVTVKGTPPTLAKHSIGRKNSGQIFISNHRTVLDAFFIYLALGCPITGLTYSSTRLLEFLSPFKVVRISRNREQDAATIKKLLQEGNNVHLCPEGTTCREPYVLRFSALFAELSDQLVPVAIVSHQSMFHGTTVRGWKAMDLFFFSMNPFPSYEVTFLNKLAPEQTCNATSGKTSFEVANYVQRIIAATLSYECTRLTRKDKYWVLAGNDGNVVRTT
ncbi:glycerol-3-phosphate acyltransferase RAM2 [Rosa sericea]